MTAALSLDLFDMESAEERAGRRLEQLLARRGMEKAEFGRKIGGDYQKAHRWTKGVGFSPRNRRVAAKALDVDPDYFDRDDAEDAVVERIAQRKRVFAEFLATDSGREAQRRGYASALEETPVPHGRTPTVAYYHGVYLNMVGLLATELVEKSVESDEKAQKEAENGLAPSNQQTKPRKR
jgi:transcriptional regulator with XRE-family HTH domain